MCYFGCLRMGEITAPERRSFDPAAHLTFGDVVVDNMEQPMSVTVRIKQSKTDPFWEKAEVDLG